MPRTAKHLAALGAALFGLGATPANAVSARSYIVKIQNISTDKTLNLPDGSTSDVPVARGAYAILAKGARGFAPGASASRALERLAEDGDPADFAAELQKAKGVRSAGTFSVGEPFKVIARPGERLVFAAMFAQSNDLFYAPSAGSIALTPGASAAPITLWDAGTEVNEIPGAGANQPARQASPGAGEAEHGVIKPVADGFTYPAVSEVLRVSVKAR